MARKSENYKGIPNQQLFVQLSFLIIQNLGGIASTKEIRKGVLEILNPTDDVLKVRSNTYRGYEFTHKLSYARTCMHNCGVLTNPEPGKEIWTVTPEYSDRKELTYEECCVLTNKGPTLRSPNSKNA